MKKILIALLILFTLFNKSNCMEEKEEHFEYLFPAELRHKIIATILEDNINSWDDIFKLDRKSLKEILNNIRLVSRDFGVFEKEQLKKFIRNLKHNRFAYLQERIKDLYKDVSKKELNKKLTDLLESDTSQNDLEESVRLIIAGADVNTNRRYGETALIMAARRGHTEIVRLLIDKGADKNTRDPYGETALMIAASEGHLEIVRLLIDKGADTKDNIAALMSATLFDHLGIVKLLIDAGTDINIRDNTGETALMTAAYKGHTKIVKLLIDVGADINIQENCGLTALSYAAHRGHTEIVRLLINEAADINIQGITRQTALIMAASRGHIEIVRLLINAGANINIRDLSGKTALMHAASQGHTEIVRLLSKQDQSFFTSSCILQ